ncbi:tyrosine-type recombinase/integrase [Paraburkholderia sprentiae]|uniref:tyrosine-type recombinase/integrase n=1 Tax=Paraburkholderia sprentiae TaxID=948107 RepID=UPI00389B26CB
MNAYQSPITRAGLKLTMFTGLRPGVVATAPWDEIDLDAGEWHVPASRMTMRHDHIVPLPRQAVALLRNLRPLTGRGHDVFASPARQKTPHLHQDALSKALRDMRFQGMHAADGIPAACYERLAGSGSASTSMFSKRNSLTRNEVTYRRPPTEQRSTTTVSYSRTPGPTMHMFAAQHPTRAVHDL